MLTEEQLIGYVEDTLTPEERASVEAELAQDESLRGRVLRQMRMDAALRASLGSVQANERVKQSVLAVLSGESEAALKQQVLEDTTFVRRKTDWTAALAEWIGKWRRPSFGFALGAAACVALMIWWFGGNHPGREQAMARVELPALIDLPAGSELVRASQPLSVVGSTSVRPGDELHVSAQGSATISFADGTALHIEPGARLVWDADVPRARAGGKQLRLLAGSLSADVAKQPAGLPLLIHTPHATITVVGTEFDLAVGTNATQLEVTHGLVKMAGANATAPIEVAAGEMAVASPDAAPRPVRLARNPYLWPFSSDSPWNTPLGSGAKYAPLPGSSFVADGPLVDAMRPRRPFLGGPKQPLRGIWVNGERRGDARFADATALPNSARDSIVLLQLGRRFAFELRNVTARADGDLAVEAVERLDLAGLGMVTTPNRAVPFGLSSLGGLIRTGELENGIRHALAARVSRERLGGRRDFATPGTVWPAGGGDVASEEMLSVGTLLALPPDVDIRKLMGNSGPGYELARAMQDFGVYVTGSINAPFALLAEGTGFNQKETDALLNKLVPLLQVVANNTPQTPGGGGEPRRERAPKFPNEVK